MRPQAQAHGQTAVVLDALADHIEKVLEAYNDFAYATGWTPAPGAPVEWESERLAKQYGPAGDWVGDDARLAFGMSALYLAVATQHLESIRLLLKERLAIFGLQLPVRTSLELCGQICWLLDPRLTHHGRNVRDRAARWCLCRMNGLTKVKTAAYSLEHPQATKFGGDHATFRKEIRRRFYKSEWLPSGDPKTKKPRDPAAIRDETYPGGADRLRYLTEIANQTDAKSRGVYDYLSSGVHPTLFAIMEAMDPSGTSGFRLDDAHLPYRLTRLALLDFLIAWRLTATYAGLEAQADPSNTLAGEVDGLPTP